VRGALLVSLYDPESTTLSRVRMVSVGNREFEIQRARRMGGARPAFLIELVGVASRDQAEALRGAEITVLRANVPMGKDEYLVADLIGCVAYDAAGQRVSEVAGMFHNGAHFVLTLADGRLLPLCDEWVVGVDIAARRIQVDLHE
jgi:16S rRNA processing protein RimM